LINQQSKFHCRHCPTELGSTDGVRLLIAVVIGGRELLLEFRDRTKPYCPICGKLSVWYPHQSQAKKVDAIGGLVVA